MISRIQQDLAPFYKGFSARELKKCFNSFKRVQGIEAFPLVYVSHRGGNITCEPLFPLTCGYAENLQGFVSAMQRLDVFLTLPDFDLLLSLSPAFDRPLFLANASVPIFAISKEKHNSKVVLVPRLWKEERESFFSTLSYPWSLKIERGIWRGSPNDGNYRSFFDWDCNPRASFVLRCLHYQELVDAALIFSDALDNYMRDWLEKLCILGSFMPPHAQAAYKYLISIDGTSTASSLEWQLFSQSLVFKANSNRIEWFYGGLVAQEHFLPFHIEKEEASIQQQILWAQYHDAEAKQIADNGYLFAVNYLLDENAFIYLYYLLCSYAELYTETTSRIGL